MIYLLWERLKKVFVYNIGFHLHNLGYDIWMLNARGNAYSTKHQKYDRYADSREYWNFSWHEIGIYDLPATIDYILPLTNFTRFHYIGHSQGVTSFFVMSSEKPEYNDKISLMIALAPTVFMGHNTNGLVQVSCHFLDIIEVRQHFWVEKFPGPYAIASNEIMKLFEF